MIQTLERYKRSARQDNYLHVPNNIEKSAIAHIRYSWLYRFKGTNCVPIKFEAQRIAEALDMSKFYNMVYCHEEYTYNSEYPVIGSNNIFVDPKRAQALLYLKQWLYQCMQHSSTLPAATLGGAVAHAFMMQPKVDNSIECDYINRISRRGTHGYGLWQNLTQTLRSLPPSSPQAWTDAEEQDVISAVKVFLRLAMQVEDSTYHGERD